MQKTPLRPCPLCEGRRCEVIHAQRFVLPEGHPLTDGYDVVCCEHCGFVYADTRVTQADYDLFYAKYSKYEDNQTATGGGETPWDVQRLEETAAAIAEALPSRDARIVDVGCANGGLLLRLQKRGFRKLAGIDPSLTCVKNTRFLGVRAEVGSLFNLPTGLGPFDCVILCHVLEHVQDLRGAMRAVRKLTAPRGLAYLEVPDAARYEECLAAPFQDFNTEHINHFSAAGLVNLGARNGLFVERQGEKTMMAPPPIPYPAVYGFFRKSADDATRAEPVKDRDLRGKIRGYVEKSRQVLAKIDDRLRGILRTAPEVIVWGVGQLAMKLLAETALATAKIAAFVDGNPIHHGKVLRGIQIMAPEEVRRLPYPIVIATTLHHRQIAETIQNRLKLPNPIITLPGNPFLAEEPAYA